MPASSSPWQITGSMAMQPITLLMNANVHGPMSSIPIFWATKALPQMKAAAIMRRLYLASRNIVSGMVDWYCAGLAGFADRAFTNPAAGRNARPAAGLRGTCRYSSSILSSSWRAATIFCEMLPGTTS